MKDLAIKLGIHYQSLSDSINGNPTLNRLNSIADALGVEVWELFERSSNIDNTAKIRCPHCGKTLNIKITE